MSSRRVTLNPGDVFEIPVSDGRLGYGVIVEGGDAPYVIVLRSVHTTRPGLSVLVDDSIALVGRTTDALIYHGRWQVVFNGYPHRNDVPFPNWRVQIDGQLAVTDFSGQHILGPPSAEEAVLLDFKFSRAPIGYLNALEAIHSLQAWQDSFKQLTPAYAKARMTRL